MVGKYICGKYNINIQYMPGTRPQRRVREMRALNSDHDGSKQERRFEKALREGYDAINDGDDRGIVSERVSQQTNVNYSQVLSTIENDKDLVLLDTLYYQLKLKDDKNVSTDNVISYSLVSNGSKNSYNFNSLRRLSNPIDTYSSTILSVSGNRFDSSYLPKNFGLGGMLKETYTIQNATNKDELENYQLEFNMLYGDVGSDNVTEGGKTVNGKIVLNCGKYNLKYNTAERVTITFNDDELKTREIKLYGYKKDPSRISNQRQRNRVFSRVGFYKTVRDSFKEMVK